MGMLFRKLVGKFVGKLQKFVEITSKDVFINKFARFVMHILRIQSQLITQFLSFAKLLNDLRSEIRRCLCTIRSILSEFLNSSFQDVMQ